jgi:DNA uptake protein ComE-like DNA-binding protein
MIGKQVVFGKQNFTAAALMATIVWLAACSPATTTSTTPSTAAEPTVAATTAAESVPAAEAATAVVKLNLNTATGEEFRTIPDVGDRMVREFEEYRPYVSILQFRKEIGKYVDEAQVAAYEEYVYVPIVPNEADAATLQQIPGVTAEIADELIAGRPYESNAAFLEALAGHVTPEQLAIGESYLESE